MPFVFNPSTGASKSGNDIIDEVYRLFMSGQREELNKLSVTAGASATSLSFQYELGSIRDGSQVEVDLESYYVWEVDGTSKTATVQPGMYGSTTAVHSTGTLARVNPKLTRASIFDALNAEIQSLSSPTNNLYSVMELEFNYSVPVIMYDLAGTEDILDILMVNQKQPGSTQDWAQMPSWRYDKSVDLTMFPSGNALYLPIGLPGSPVRVVYSVPFATISNPASDLYLDGNGDPKEGGISPSMHDILVYGILLRLGPVREIKRNFTEAQGDSKRATEVPPGAVMNSYTEVRRIYTRRMNEEAAKLARDFPTQRPQ